MEEKEHSDQTNTRNESSTDNLPNTDVRQSHNEPQEDKNEHDNNKQQPMRTNDNNIESDDLEHLIEQNNYEEYQINLLKQASLLTLQVVLQDQPTSAMIDSGAAMSFIKEDLVHELRLPIEYHITNVIEYGNSQIKTKGMVETNITIANYQIPCKFHILARTAIQQPIVLGLDFLKQCKADLDIRNRTLSLNRPNKGRVTLRLEKDSYQVENAEFNSIPVHAVRELSLEADELGCMEMEAQNLRMAAGENYLFEGRNDGREFLCGIVTEEKRTVIVKNMTGKRQKVKKGEIIGFVSTLLEDAEEALDDEWSIEKVEKEVNLKNENLSDSERRKVYDMLASVNKALSNHDDDIGEAQVTPHQIRLSKETPVWQRPRTFAQPINDEIEQQCNELLSSDIIEMSNSSWSSPCVPVRKSDGSLRLCIDYRKLNAATITEKFPMPNLNHCLYKAHQMNWFTKLDLVRGYYQIKLEEKSKEYTAFSTPQNQYQFKRLPFGLKNAGIAFQKAMQTVLAPFRSSNVVIYIDDILIMTETFEEHLELVNKVLNTLAQYRIKVKVRKCEFFQSEVVFLGHVMNAGGIRKSEEYKKKVEEYPQPKTTTELRRFLGLINFHRKFIKHCSGIAKPLTEITGGPKKAKIEWTEERLEAFRKLKEEVSQEVSLTYPDYSSNASKLELYVDASSTAAGACLLQQQNGAYRVIGYGSMCFSPTQQNYSTIERELTAIRWGVENFKCFIYGIDFVLYTDHKPLVYMSNMAPHSSRIHRTLIELSEYNYVIKYLPGAENDAADALSRMDPEVLEAEQQQEGIPQEFQVRAVAGGGNSMFESLKMSLETISEEDEQEQLPHSHLEMRKEIINELIEHPEKYKISKNKQERNKLKLMLNSNELPCSQALLAASQLYKIEIRVYHNIKTPVIYRATQENNQRIVNLQCISYIHFNPIFSYRKSKSVNDDRSVNMVIDKREVTHFEFDDTKDIDIGCLFEEKNNIQRSCKHEPFNINAVILCNGHILCSLLDTGAQVSLISEAAYHKLADENTTMDR